MSRVERRCRVTGCQWLNMLTAMKRQAVEKAVLEGGSREETSLAKGALLETLIALRVTNSGTTKSVATATDCGKLIIARTEMKAPVKRWAREEIVDASPVIWTSGWVASLFATCEAVT